MNMKRKPVHGASPEQLAALNKWAADFRKAAPAMQRTAAAAKKIHQDMLAAPLWRAVEGQVPADMQRPVEAKDPFSIGAPKVNYVKHIDIPGDPHESPANGKDES